MERKIGTEDKTDEKVVDITLKDLSRKLEEFAKARDWEKYHSPRNLLLAMVNFFYILPISILFLIFTSIAMCSFYYSLMSHPSLFDSFMNNK